VNLRHDVLYEAPPIGSTIIMSPPHHLCNAVCPSVSLRSRKTTRGCASAVTHSEKKKMKLEERIDGGAKTGLEARSLDESGGFGGPCEPVGMIQLWTLTIGHLKFSPCSACVVWQRAGVRGF
jgi:hypothetical protein